jgi:ribonucleotide reductase beta subunit family protein with ferritin-like domain
MLEVEKFCEILEIDRENIKKIKKYYSDDDLKNNLVIEPLLMEEQRLCLAPIKHHDIWQLYKKQLDSFWTREEIDLSKDYDDFKKLDKNTKYFIKYILAFFATSDGSVFLNLMENFTKEVKIMEAQICYQFQGMMEAIHSEVYSLMIEELIKDENEKEELFNAIEKIPCIKRKAEWGQIWATSKTKFAQRLIAFAIVEGIFFSGSFCAIYWLKQQNILPGLTQSNEFIARDEAQHCEYACLLYSKIINKIPEVTVKQMIIDAVRIEKEFIIESLPCKLIGMNSTLMSQYIEFIADKLIQNLGYSKIYNVLNPFPFMENINLNLKSNFFETRTTSYQKPDLTNISVEISEDF